jgi:hypothetical protein
LERKSSQNKFGTKAESKINLERKPKSVIVFHASNLHFGPEVGVSRTLKRDALVVENWISEIKTMAHDLRFSKPDDKSHAITYHAFATQLENRLKPNSISAVLTSPPYPNEKDYTRTTRLESVLLGFINDKADLRRLKQGLLRSNTRNITTRISYNKGLDCAKLHVIGFQQ